MSLNPKARTRATTVTLRPTMQGDLSNGELLDLFLRSLDAGKVALSTVARFRYHIQRRTGISSARTGRKHPFERGRRSRCGAMSTS